MTKLDAFYILWDAQKHILHRTPYPLRLTLEDMAAVNILAVLEREAMHEVRNEVR